MTKSIILDQKLRESILLFTYSIAMHNGFGSFNKSFNRNFILLIPQILASYYIIYYLNPSFLFKKKYFQFIVLFVIGTYVFSILARVLLIHVIEEMYREPPFRKEPLYEIATDLKRLYKDFFYRVYLPVFLVISIKLIKERFEEKSRQEILQRENPAYRAYMEAVEQQDTEKAQELAKEWHKIKAERERLTNAIRAK